LTDCYLLNTVLSELFGIHSTYTDCGHFRRLLDVQIELNISYACAKTIKLVDAERD